MLPWPLCYLGYRKYTSGHLEHKDMAFSDGMGSCHAMNFKREVLDSSVPCMVMELALLLLYNLEWKRTTV